MDRTWDYNVQGPSIYPKYAWRNPWRGFDMILSHAKRTADRKPRALESLNSSNYRYKNTATWIQALVNANEGVHPCCSKSECRETAEHGAHMLAVELDWEGRELKLINNNTGEIESERQQ
jgi:hypothetical protein